ncbi:hypothetical protein BX600DRAFT_43925 [Xylariales sp. PMI_506]|nr:hypothetical protein BX600DRAFT_43925 [Xylariales sp. PMI_506]
MDYGTASLTSCMGTAASLASLSRTYPKSARLDVTSFLNTLVQMRKPSSFPARFPTGIPSLALRHRGGRQARAHQGVLLLVGPVRRRRRGLISWGSSQTPLTLHRTFPPAEYATAQGQPAGGRGDAAHIISPESGLSLLSQAPPERILWLFLCCFQTTAIGYWKLTR